MPLVGNHLQHVERRLVAPGQELESGAIPADIQRIRTTALVHFDAGPNGPERIGQVELQIPLGKLRASVG